MKLALALLLCGIVQAGAISFTSATAQDGDLTCSSPSFCQILPDRFSGASSSASEDGSVFRVSAYVGSNFVYVQASAEASYGSTLTFTGATGDGIATLTFFTGADIVACCDSTSGVEENLSVMLGETTESFTYYGFYTYLPTGTWTISTPFTFGQPVEFDVDLYVLAATRLYQAAGDYGFLLTSITTTDPNGNPIQDGVESGPSVPEPGSWMLIVLGLLLLRAVAYLREVAARVASAPCA